MAATDKNNGAAGWAPIAQHGGSKEAADETKTSMKRKITKISTWHRQHHGESKRQP